MIVRELRYDKKQRILECCTYLEVHCPEHPDGGNTIMTMSSQKKDLVRVTTYRQSTEKLNNGYRKFRSNQEFCRNNQREISTI